MNFPVFTARLRIARLGRSFLAVLLVLFAFASLGTPQDAQARPAAKSKKSQKAKSEDESNGPKPNPDALLSAIYMDLAAGQLRPALAKADKLVEAYPKFRLAHLVRGDLLMMHAHPVATFGATTGDAANGRLQELRAEAMVRLKMLHRVPDPGLHPRIFTHLRDDHKFVVLVDASQSRLFVYRNKGGQLALMNHYYVSQGKLGVDKFREGDQKTPLGIYRITSRIPAAKLPDFYGTGALPLNYPNDWDKVHGRGGSGIWLHGMPSESFSRPPLASDGCVALTNPDMTELASTLDIYKTLVVISDRVELVNAAVLNKDRKMANALLEKWRRDVEYGNPKYLLRHYSDKFRSSANDDLKTWFEKQYPANGSADSNYKLRDVSLMRYPGNGTMIAAAFKLYVKTGRITSETRRFQLWAKEGAQWKIVFENTIKDFL
jgi:murein L,D-transpeptidase YafK